MSDHAPDYLSFVCPHCRKKLRAPLAVAGQRLKCPKCSSVIPVPELPDRVSEVQTAAPQVPQSKDDDPQAVQSSHAKSDSGEMQLASTDSPIPKNQPRRSVFDDDLPDLLPIPNEAESLGSTQAANSVIPKKSPSKSTRSKEVDPFLTEVQREALEKARETSSHPSGPIAKPQSGKDSESAPDELRLESSALGDDFSIPKDDEFRFVCRVCGSLLSANKSRIGTKTRCPDCYSEFLIPKPVEKRKPPEIKLDENIQVKLQPLEARNSRVGSDVDKNTQEILSKAAVEADREREEIEQINYAFDTSRWLGLIFGFLYDPMVIVVAFGLGLITCFWLVGMEAIGTTIKLAPILALVLRALMFGLFFLPIGGTIFLCGIAILTMAANRSPRVTDWPFAKIGDSVSEAFVVLAAFLISSLPGGVIGTMLSTLGAQLGVSTGLAMVSIWGFFPIVLLSMINNNSVFEPYSKPIVETMKTHGDAWGAMYIQSGIAFLVLFGLCLLTLLRGIAGEILCGLFWPLVTFFIFNQYGVLAGRISESTELGFHGDFSED